MPLEEPFEAVGDFFASEIAGYSVLQLTVAAVTIAGIAGVTVYGVKKLLGTGS